MQSFTGQRESLPTHESGLFQVCVAAEPFSCNCHAASTNLPEPIPFAGSSNHFDSGSRQSSNPRIRIRAKAEVLSAIYAAYELPPFAWVIIVDAAGLGGALRAYALCGTWAAGRFAPIFALARCIRRRRSQKHNPACDGCCQRQHQQ